MGEPTTPSVKDLLVDIELAGEDFAAALDRYRKIRPQFNTPTVAKIVKDARGLARVAKIERLRTIKEQKDG